MQSSRKGKERDARDLPQPTDIDEKITALRRRTAATTRPKDRAERDRMLQQQPVQIQPSQHSDRSPKLSPRSPPRRPHVRPTQDAADADDFSRRLKISPSSRPHPPHKASQPSKLFNPDTDPIPVRRTAEPESTSDASSYVHVSREDRGIPVRQLFDHRKDDPVRFSVLARPQHRPSTKASNDQVSASSTSSYAASTTFTLSSTTDGSSTSSALFDGRPNLGQGTSDSGNNIFSVQLKKLYRAITHLESKIKQEDSTEEPDDPMSIRLMLKGKELENEESEREKWKKQIDDHKQLAEIIHNLLEISSAPSVPASLRNLPTNYNIINRLWIYAFYKLLESLRRASSSSPMALEHLQDFIYYAYTFYTGLLEEPNLNSYKSGWLEALGDLARYRMAVAALVGSRISGRQGGLTTKALTEAGAESTPDSSVENSAMSSPASAKSFSDAPAARIDDSPSPSIGLAAARLLDVEPEKERWRNIARDWYAAGLAEQPGTGKLHHHLGLLSREGEGEELREVYHFVKSMTTLHPFPTSRESVLHLWSHPNQARRSVPDTCASDLFVFLHGMLFTNIQLDDFQPSLARFIERLEIEGAEEREWIMMAIINVSSVFEYGRPTGVLRKVGCVGSKAVNGPQVAAAMRVMAKKAAAGVPGSTSTGGVDEEKMDVDDEHKGDTVMKSPTLSNAEPQSEINALPEHPPPAFKFALELTFAILSHVLQRPTRKSSQYARSNLNPYLTVILTFLSTILKHRPTLDVLERSIPWNELVAFFATIPRTIMIRQGLMNAPGSASHARSAERWAMITSGCAPPLPEDWCLRGMEWVGRNVYERGFWKSGEDRKAELEVLETSEAGEITDGTIEDDDGDEDRKSTPEGRSDLNRRWVRITRCAVNIAGFVDGFNWMDGSREWKVEGKLSDKVRQWKEEDEIERQEEMNRRLGKRWVDDAMDVDDIEEDSVSEESEDDENDSVEIKALKARRRYLQNLLQSEKRTGPPSSSPPRQSRVPRPHKKSAASRRKLSIVAGYTNLIIDTNILLSSLSMVSSLVESFRWTIVIPLPVIMELDGLSSNTVQQLSEAAQAAMSYISSHIRSHGLSLKVQTSKGNYLTSLNVRTEEVDFKGTNAEKSMDDLILKAAIWQDEHWVDRSSMLQAHPASTTGERQDAIKVVLLSLDRNLRLKARSRQLPAASEIDLAHLLASAK